MWTSRRKAVLAACRAARLVGNTDQVHISQVFNTFFLVPYWSSCHSLVCLFARIVLRVVFRTCIAFAGRTDSGSGVRDALLSFRSRCLMFPDLVYFFFLVSKSLFSIFIRSWICFTFRAFEQCCG